MHVGSRSFSRRPAAGIRGRGGDCSIRVGTVTNAAISSGGIGLTPLSRLRYYLSFSVYFPVVAGDPKS